MVFEGVCTALVTPFDKQGNVDFAALKGLLEKQIEGGIGAVCVLGSTGEAATIGEEERDKIISFVKTNLPPWCKVIVGASSNDTKKACEFCQRAKELKADACLVSTPYYNKCTQEGVFLHFKKVAFQAGLPVIVYNVPSRTGVNISPETMKKIIKLDNIVALKEANGDIHHILDMFDALPKGFAIYSGNDELNSIFKFLGGSGCISVMSNAFPKKTIEAWEMGGFEKDFYKLGKMLFCEPNPIPIKYVLSQMGEIRNVLRMPLTKIEREHAKELDKLLKDLL